jgi:Tfp pilus assembly protein PilO
MTFDYRKQYQEYRHYIDSLVEKAKTPVTRVSLAIVGAIAFSVFLAVFALRPTLITVAGLWKEINTEKTTITALDRKLKLLQAAKQNYDQASSRLYLLDTAGPQTVEIESMARELEVLAAENSLNTLEFREEKFWLLSPSPAGSLPVNVSGIDVMVSVGGQEAGIRNFVGNLEKLGRMVKINAITARAVPEKERIERPFPVYATLGITMFTSQPGVLDEPLPVIKEKEQL